MRQFEIFIFAVCICLQRSSSMMMHAINPITEASKRPGSPAFLVAQLTLLYPLLNILNLVGIQDGEISFDV